MRLAQHDHMGHDEKLQAQLLHPACTPLKHTTEDLALLRTPLTSYFFTSAKRSRRKNVAQPSMAYADPV